MKVESLQRTLLGVIIAVYLAMAALSAWTLLPGCDEAWFTLPGYDLVTNGRFGTAVLDETARFRQVRLDGINQRTYWIMPAYPLLQGLAGKVFGFGLLTTRSVSIFFGLVAVIAAYLFVGRLSEARSTALIASGLIATDQFFIFAAGFGRMDMMTFALGLGALAAYVQLRETRLTRAIAVSFAMAAAASFAHPLGLMWAVSLSLIVLYFDRRQLQLMHLAIAGAPFVLMAGVWGLYISRDPALFAVQFGGNASDRWAFFASPLSELGREISLRYLANFGLADGISGAALVKLAPLMILLAASAYALASKHLRSQQHIRILLALAAQQFVMIMLLDSLKQGYYLVHMLPTLIMITAAVAGWAIRQGSFARYAAAAACIVFLGVNLMTEVARIRRDHLHNYFLTTAAVIDREAGPDDRIFASAEFWFAIARPERLIDDYRLGAVSGREAVLIVLDQQRYRDWIDNLAATEPTIHRQINEMLENKYLSIFRNDRYEVFKRKP